MLEDARDRRLRARAADVTAPHDPPPLDAIALKDWLATRYPDVATIATHALHAWLVDESRVQPVVIDVRSPEEQAVSSLRNAWFASDAASAVAAVAGRARDVPIVVCCSVGVRSARAARALLSHGYRSVSNLGGGLFAWANEGRPLARNDMPTDFVHPYDDRWGTLLDRRRHARTPRQG